ncbi:MAG TPA: aldehyde dehydrogenase family protein, partial [Acidimicrobiales bacterium]|nr:aldehyde dehydrogenase family protein [Acidimicrobiales bacterium]
LGGKSAAVLLEDVDLDVFAGAMLQQCVPYSAQVCYSCTRILAPASRYGEVLDAVVARMESFAFGHPADPDVEMGPLVTARQRDRVEGLIASGLGDGARTVLGGGRPKGFSTGFYIEPTVFVDVQPAMRIFCEEIFGPVLCVVPYHGEDEAVALHNATDYGLSGSVFSADVERAVDFARRLETGAVRVNGARGAAGLVHAAYKGSGLGMGGQARIADYQLVKDVTLPA